MLRFFSLSVSRYKKKGIQTVTKQNKTAPHNFSFHKFAMWIWPGFIWYIDDSVLWAAATTARASIPAAGTLSSNLQSHMLLDNYWTGHRGPMKAVESGKMEADQWRWVSGWVLFHQEWWYNGAGWGHARWEMVCVTCTGCYSSGSSSPDPPKELGQEDLAQSCLLAVKGVMEG